MYTSLDHSSGSDLDDLDSDSEDLVSDESDSDDSDLDSSECSRASGVQSRLTDHHQ